MTKDKWITRDLRVVPISKMETSHLVNSINKIRRSLARGGSWRAEFLPALETELFVRQLPARTRNWIRGGCK